MTFTRILMKHCLKYLKCVFHYVIHEKKTIDINKPYNTRHIKQLFFEKEILLKLHNRCPLTYWSAYKACRDKVKIEVRKAKKEYFKDNLKRNEQNPKQLGRYINEMIGRTQGESKKNYELNGPNGIVIIVVILQMC